MIYNVLKLCYKVYFVIVCKITFRLGSKRKWKGGGTSRHTDTGTDVTTYRLNRPRVRFSENPDDIFEYPHWRYMFGYISVFPKKANRLSLYIMFPMAGGSYEICYSNSLKVQESAYWAQIIFHSVDKIASLSWIMSNLLSYLFMAGLTTE